MCGKGGGQIDPRFNMATQGDVKIRFPEYSPARRKTVSGRSRLLSYRTLNTTIVIYLPCILPCSSQYHMLGFSPTPHPIWNIMVVYIRVHVFILAMSLHSCFFI